MNPVRGILIFSLIETIGVIVWLAIVIPKEVLTVKPLLGGIVLFLFYVLEHVAAWNTAKNRSLFTKPRH